MEDLHRRLSTIVGSAPPDLAVPALAEDLDGQPPAEVLRFLHRRILDAYERLLIAGCRGTIVRVNRVDRRAPRSRDLTRSQWRVRSRPPWVRDWVRTRV